MGDTREDTGSTNTSASSPLSKALPKVLVTGFSRFGNNQINPSELLINHLLSTSSSFESTCQLKCMVLKVEYLSLIPTLSTSLENFNPDISIHFGLSSLANGITLERLARNSCGEGKDVVGYSPSVPTICEGLSDIPSTLPLQEIGIRLKEEGVNWSWSDNAGGYLCNYIFFIGRSGLCPGLNPKVSGFIHLPPLREGKMDDTLNSMEMGDMVQAAKIIIEESVKKFNG